MPTGMIAINFITDRRDAVFTEEDGAVELCFRGLPALDLEA
jgi:hypothetical protein